MKKKLPIGYSSLSKVIENGCVYIDKTHHVAKLVDAGEYYFLSRPRRFGKSLFLDTLKQAFLGNKELFKGLYLEKNWNWDIKYPVIHISFASNQPYTAEYTLADKINTLLEINADNYGLKLRGNNYSDNFLFLIIDLYNLHNNPVVILIDEYDKPILDVIDDLEKAKTSREILRGFYGCLKDNDQYLRFVFLTGVTKFSKVSLFSGLNNLRDLTINSEYADICGYTQAELEDKFNEYLVGVDKKQLKHWYNGYNFGDHETKKVYNPFDILLFFANDKEYRNYWFETATPTFLLELLKNNRYYLPDLENLYASEDLLSSFDIDNIKFETLLFQSGYLTIIDKVSSQLDAADSYLLNYPNYEVRKSFTSSLLNYFINDNSIISSTNRLLADVLVNHDFDRLKQVLTSFFAGLPYNWYVNNNIAEFEGFYATIIYCLFNSLGITAIPEDTTNKGWIDLTIHLPEYKIIMEFKLTTLGDAKSAIQQIKDKNYAQKYLAEKKPIYLIGISFNVNERNLDGLVWEKLVQV